MTSVIRGDDNFDSAGIVDGAAKAWVNFNGTGTVAIRASFNVASITDNGTGDYTVNFTNAMPDANYSVSGNQGANSGFSATSLAIGQAALITSAVRVNTSRNDTAAAIDLVYVNVTIHR